MDLKRGFELVFVFWLGGFLYGLTEILWRGYTHWSMILTGGACFSMLYGLHIHAREIPFVLRCVLGTAGITAAEFLVGCVVNLWLGLRVWDYSRMPLNVYGQICPVFSVMWLFLSGLSCPLCRFLSRKIQGRTESPSCETSGVGV